MYRGEKEIKNHHITSLHNRMSSVSQQSLFAPSHTIMHIPLPPPRPVPTNTDLTRLCWQQDGTPHEEFGFDRTNLARLLHIHTAKTSRCSFTALHHLWIFGCFAVRLIVVLMNQGRFMASDTSHFPSSRTRKPKDMSASGEGQRDISRASQQRWQQARRFSGTLLKGTFPRPQGSDCFDIFFTTSSIRNKRLPLPSLFLNYSIPLNSHPHPHSGITESFTALLL